MNADNTLRSSSLRSTSQRGYGETDHVHSFSPAVPHAEAKGPPLYLWVLPLLFIPVPALSFETAIGVIDPCDFVLVLLYPALLLGSGRRSGVPGEVKFWFLAFLTLALTSTLLIPLRYPDYGDTGHLVALGVGKLAKFLAYALLGLLVARRIGGEDRRAVMKSLAAGGLVLAGGIIWTALVWTPGGQRLASPRYPYESSNAVGVALAALAVFFVTAPRQERPGLSGDERLEGQAVPGGPSLLLGRRFLLPGVLLAAMFLTMGRGGWAGAILGFAYVVFHERRGWTGRFGAGLLAVTAVVLFAWVGYVKYNVEDLVIVEENPLRPGAVRWRLDDQGRFGNWLHEGRRIVEAPVLGVGFYNRSGASGLWWTGSHNFFVQMALETGLLGLWALGMLFWQVWKSVPLRAESGLTRRREQMNLAFRGTLVAACGGAMTGEYFYGGLVLGTVSILFGITVSSARAAAEAGSDKASPGRGFASSAPVLERHR